MTHNSQKIQGKFYPLQTNEWINVCKSLTKSQISLLYYLRSSDPYGNGVKIKASDIAKEIGITKRAVNAAIAVLEEKGYINLEDIEYSVKVNSGGCLCDNSDSGTQVGREFPTQEENFPPEKSSSHLGREFPTEEENFPLENRISHSSAETTVQQEVETSKINKTYKDFKDSLSEDERESFLEFSKNKAASLPKPPQLPMKWIEANFEELRYLWEKQNNANGSIHCEAESSTKILCFESWDKSSHEGQYHALMNLGLAKFCENSTSSAWYEWAKATYPEKFVDVPS
ncbi:MarR family transcriptional regulator [Plectonema cf. radiosum LEGE 06105]|uniref:MarR family transcriptional regulator n=1 Tax=Plectonema cf. radiosum LEGE 06105 TaxID=945769 RepID=A0A8J7JWF8_9CYAN|nr:helix-turn-helix domain-containing protein [Plectonema radiosum]MBE9216809.1 MarR family transcriptional regulator [Plectonema cf. radiosum LEGE 06105]